MLSEAASSVAGGDLIGYLTAGGVGAVFLEIVRSIKQRRKMGADTAEVISRSALTLLEPLEARVKSLQQSLNATEMELVGTQQQLADTRIELADTKRELVAARQEIETMRKESRTLRDENRQERLDIADRAERQSDANREERADVRKDRRGG